MARQQVEAVAFLDDVLDHANGGADLARAHPLAAQHALLIAAFATLEAARILVAGSLEEHQNSPPMADTAVRPVLSAAPTTWRTFSTA